ncbi:hypothetical protein [Paraburkholderia sp. MPAMCS5]
MSRRCMCRSVVSDTEIYEVGGFRECGCEVVT